jgi:DNA-binding HxlR family transcriptional regulator
MTVRNTHQWISKMAENTEDLVDILSKADAFCQYCKPAFPMQCVEQCEIWRTKNEFLEMNGIFGRDKHLHNLLNAIKNSRRQTILDALSERPHGAKGLQEYLKSKGFQHSQHTILIIYVEPLIETGLVKRDGAKYRLTLYGVKFHQVLSKFNIENLLPPHSRCYEEIVLKKLRDGLKSYAELSKSLTQKSLSRTLKRLHKNGLISRSETSEYIFYFRTKKVPKNPFSPTEKKLYMNIPDNGISTRQLSNRVGISIRRTYKYLRKLQKRRLAFARKKPRTYSLTSDGTELADFLEETAKLVSDASKASNYLLQRSRETKIHRPPQLPPMLSESSLRERDTERKDW